MDIVCEVQEHDPRQRGARQIEANSTILREEFGDPLLLLRGGQAPEVFGDPGHIDFGEKYP